MVFPDKFYEIVQHECTISITTNGMNGAQTKNVWNVQVRITDNGTLFLPLEDYEATERNIKLNNTTKLTIRGSDSNGFAAGFLMKGNSCFCNFGVIHDELKNIYPFAQILEVSLTGCKQLLA